MYAFDYHRASSLDDAVAKLKADADAKLVAGGMTLIPTMKQRLAQPSKLIDLGGIEDIVGVREDGGRVVIGAMTTHGMVMKSDVVRAKIPALSHLASHVGDPQVRNRGTLGGSIANNDPAADYPAALVALDAQVTTDRRTIAAEDFFTGMFETALEDDEIIREVSFVVPEKAGYAKFANPASRYAIVGVFVAKHGGGVRVAVTGAGPSVFRLGDLEQALGQNFAAAAADGVSVSAGDLNSDIHASADYRAHLVKVMAKRAIQAAGG